MDTVFKKQDTSIVKGIAILMMLTHHLCGFPDRIEGLELTSSMIAIGEACKLCVVTFMFLSGYGLAVSYINKNINFGDTVKRIAKTYRGLLYIFVIFVPIGICLNKISIGGGKMLFLNMLCIDYSYNKEWWFIGTYIEYLFILPFILKTRKHLWLVLLISSVILRICSSEIHFENGIVNLQIYNFCYYYPSFALGLAFGHYHLFEYICKLLKDKRLLIVATCLLVVALCFVVRKKADMPIMTVLLIPFFCLLISQLRFSTKCDACLLFLGKNSMNMWLIHTFIIYYYWQNTFLICCMRNPVIGLVELVIISLIMAVGVEYFWRKVIKIFETLIVEHSKQ